MTLFALRIEQGPRENIEDAAAAGRVVTAVPHNSEAGWMIVLDGVGGANYGEIASNLSKRHMVSTLSALAATVTGRNGDDQLSTDEILGVLCDSLAQTNQFVLQQAVENPQLNGMATTAVCTLIVNDILHVAWVGDSRCYHFGSRGLTQITRDHSQAAELAEAGVITAEEAGTHPLAHTITRYLRQPSRFQAEAQACRINAGDIVLLCTDGLTDVVSDESITHWLASYQSGELAFDELPHLLVRHAMRSGTQDNVTVLCCEYGTPPHAQPQSIERTLMGAYPVEMAIAMQHLTQEVNHA